ncbi:MAG: 4Fe-4S binding protein [Fervidicoccaceae archaeon]
MKTGSIDLSVSLFDRILPNPLIIASGPNVKNDEDILKCIIHGAGGVVTKTITFDRNQQVQPRPRMYVLNKKEMMTRKAFYSFYSIDLMSEYPPEKWVTMLKRSRSRISQMNLEGVIIASIAGRTYEEWEKLADLVASAEVDAIELNLSCPHVEPGEALMGRAASEDPSIVRKIVKSVKSYSKGIPVIGKLTPHGANPVIIAKAMKDGGADAVVSTARYRGLLIDVNNLQPVGWDSFGGYGGPWQLPISLAWTAQLARENLGIPIIGSGGITSGEDIARFILVGSQAVQTCTTILLHGLGIIGRMLDELRTWMSRKGFTRIDEFRGIVLQKIKSIEQLNREKIYVIKINKNKCILCGRCIETCPYNALRKDDNSIYYSFELCDNCGLCVSICPVDAIELVNTKG